MFIQQMDVLFVIEVSEIWTACDLQIIFFKNTKEEPQFLLQFVDGFSHRLNA